MAVDKQKSSCSTWGLPHKQIGGGDTSNTWCRLLSEHSQVNQMITFSLKYLSLTLFDQLQHDCALHEIFLNYIEFCLMYTWYPFSLTYLFKKNDDLIMHCDFPPALPSTKHPFKSVTLKKNIFVI